MPVPVPLPVHVRGERPYERPRDLALVRPDTAALSASKNPQDASLWRDWYRFTLDMAMAGAFSDDPTERKMARAFITTAIGADPDGRLPSGWVTRKPSSNEWINNGEMP